MKAQEQAEGKQAHLLISVVCVVIMLGLIWVALNKTNQSRGDWDGSVGEIMERDFRVAVANIIAQAKLQGRVKRIEQDGRWIDVNRSGRPMVLDAEGKPDCAAIWQQVMNLELDNPSYPVSIVLIGENLSAQETHWRCRYLNRTGAFFEYAPEVAH